MSNQPIGKILFNLSLSFDSYFFLWFNHRLFLCFSYILQLSILHLHSCHNSLFLSIRLLILILRSKRAQLVLRDNDTMPYGVKNISYGTQYRHVRIENRFYEGLFLKLKTFQK